MDTKHRDRVLELMETLHSEITVSKNIVYEVETKRAEVEKALARQQDSRIRVSKLQAQLYALLPEGALA